MIRFERAGVVAVDGTRLLEPTTIEIGERRVAIIGANGSGKSTLVRMINGLITPSEGSVTVNGLDTKRDGAAVRAIVGFLFTDPEAQLIMPTAIEDIELSLRRLIPHSEARRVAATEQLARIGLGKRVHTPVHSLSGGQKQLLALAGILATNPQFLVADEPTTLLDMRWRRHVDSLLAELPQTVIEVTHDLSAAARADRCLVVDDARVVFDGAPDGAVAMYTELMNSMGPPQ